jgi:hypothetical protein
VVEGGSGAVGSLLGCALRVLRLGGAWCPLWCGCEVAAAPAAGAAVALLLLATCGKSGCDSGDLSRVTGWVVASVRLVASVRTAGGLIKRLTGVADAACEPASALLEVLGAALAVAVAAVRCLAFAEVLALELAVRLEGRGGCRWGAAFGPPASGDIRWSAAASGPGGRTHAIYGAIMLPTVYTKRCQTRCIIVIDATQQRCICHHHHHQQQQQQQQQQQLTLPAQASQWAT